VNVRNQPITHTSTSMHAPFTALELVTRDEIALASQRRAVPLVLALQLALALSVSSAIATVTYVRSSTLAVVSSVGMMTFVTPDAASLVGNPLSFPPTTFFVREASDLEQILVYALDGYFSPELTSLIVPAWRDPSDCPSLSWDRRQQPWLASSGRARGPDEDYWGAIETERFVFCNESSVTNWKASVLSGEVEDPLGFVFPRLVAVTESILTGTLSLPFGFQLETRLEGGRNPCVTGTVSFELLAIAQGAVQVKLQSSYAAPSSPEECPSFLTGVTFPDPLTAAVVSSLVFGVALTIVLFRRAVFAVYVVLVVHSVAPRDTSRCSRRWKVERGACCVVFGLYDWLSLAAAVCSVVVSATLIAGGEYADLVMDSGGSRLFVGIGAALVWFSLLRAARHRPACAAAHRTLLRSLRPVAGYAVGVLPLFMAFVVFAVAALGKDAARFSSVSDTIVTLFSLINGDSVRETFLMASTPEDTTLGYFVALIAMFLFVIIVLYFVLNGCIALLEEAFVLQRPEYDVPHVDAAEARLHKHHDHDGSPWSFELDDLEPGVSLVCGPQAREVLEKVQAWALLN
jgi:hypothetical protein